MNDDDERVDPAAHEKLLNLYNQNTKNDVRRELGISGDASEAGLSQDGDLSLNQLIKQSSKNSKKALTDKFSKSGASKTLKVGANTIAAKAAEQSIDFKAVSNEVSDWEPIVKANRQSEKLLFPLDKEPLTHFATTSDLVKRSAHNPTTLEQQVYATLQASSDCVPNKETGLTSKEENLLNSMDVDEALIRLKELRKHRILTSNQLARFKREKSIKSKKFKRLKTKYKMEKLQAELGAKGLSTMLRDRRIQERSTLRHRVTGKWDRKLAHYAKNEKSTRDELESKRELNKKLTAKQNDEGMEVDEEVDDSESEDEWQVVTNKRGPSNSSSNNPNPSNTIDSSDSDSEPLVDDVEPEEITEFRKDLIDIGETTLEIGGQLKRKHQKPSNQLQLKPSEFLKAPVSSQKDTFLTTSANTSAIHEAFEDDEDLIEEMASDDNEEKTEAAVDIQNFGWGSNWFGPRGTVITSNYKRSFQSRDTEAASSIEVEKPRKRDENVKQMGYVVFNNVNNRKLAEHQLTAKDVPYGYKKPEALESSLRQPIGPDFNTASSFRSLVEPRIRKKVGVAIEPISKDQSKSKLTL